MTTILGIKLNDRQNSAVKFQEILTKFGCSIKTRIGLHSTDSQKCYPDGIILLEVTDESAKELELKLCEIESIEIQHMVF